jgi:hypothetical protein
VEAAVQHAPGSRLDDVAPGCQLQTRPEYPEWRSVGSVRDERRPFGLRDVPDDVLKQEVLVVRVGFLAVVDRRVVVSLRIRETDGPNFEALRRPRLCRLEVAVPDGFCLRPPVRISS